MKSFKFRIAAATLTAALAGPAAAEMELSLYSGVQTLPHSNLSGTYPAGGSFSRHVKWNGKSFAAPPYYGARAMWWRPSNIGWGVEFTHAKAYASDADMNALGFSSLEFTDGHNLITVNVMKRWPDRWGGFTPYAGAGLGVAVPHVDATTTGGSRTYGYQLTGPAARLTAGAKYDLNDKWAVFGEYQFTYSDNDVDLNGGGSMKTTLITNALNFGLSYKF
ncbi:outer membrane protein [Sediminimonas qiaohouensis]|uniref:outer membrane protein n=1 Tax=Sediminimonas qiaohouensis TaxID=552061 RepID=UPI0004070E01|nr:outer membrane beta-barrel protein [Sediminimonas qiaohouensis]